MGIAEINLFVPRHIAAQIAAKRTGAAAVEFVVILPLLVVLGLTSVDFGRFVSSYLAVGNAARVGAEVAATRSYSTASASTFQQQVDTAMREEFALAAGLDPGQLGVSIEVASDIYDLNRFTVTATYPFSTVVTWPGIPRPLEMSRTITYRRFR
jgi:Flp pilus assembly protein TadG